MYGYKCAIISSGIIKRNNLVYPSKNGNTCVKPVNRYPLSGTMWWYVL